MPPIHIAVPGAHWFGAHGLELSRAGFSAGVSGMAGLLMLLASAGNSRRGFGECRRFAVRFKFLLFHCALAGLGAGLVAYSGARLLALGAGDWAGWSIFAVGFVLVLLVVSAWPGPLVFDWDGIQEKGSASSRIHWEDVNQVREFRARRDRGILIHSRTGKTLTVSFTTYRCDEVIESLVREWSIPVQPLEAEAELPLPLSGPFQHAPSSATLSGKFRR